MKNNFTAKLLNMLNEEYRELKNSGDEPKTNVEFVVTVKFGITPEATHMDDLPFGRVFNVVGKDASTNLKMFRAFQLLLQEMQIHHEQIQFTISDDVLKPNEVFAALLSKFLRDIGGVASDMILPLQSRTCLMHHMSLSLAGIGLQIEGSIPIYFWDIDKNKLGAHHNNSDDQC